MLDNRPRVLNVALCIRCGIKHAERTYNCMREREFYDQYSSLSHLQLYISILVSFFLEHCSTIEWTKRIQNNAVQYNIFIPIIVIYHNRNIIASELSYGTVVCTVLPRYKEPLIYGTACQVPLMY